MRKKIAFIVCVAIMFTQQIVADDFDVYYKKLEQFQMGANFEDTDISFLLTLVIEKPHEPKKAVQYRLFRRDAKELATLVQLAPEVDKGTGILMAGSNLWVYDPVSRKFTHSSLKEQLGTSDARASDVSKRDDIRSVYKITDVRHGMLGKFKVDIISMDVINNDSDYAKEVYYVRADNDLLLKVESYGANGRHMRTVLIPKYTRVAGRVHPAQTIIRDEINKGEKTTQIMSSFSTAKIPEKVFTKAYLEEIN